MTHFMLIFNRKKMIAYVEYMLSLIKHSKTMIKYHKYKFEYFFSMI